MLTAKERSGLKEILNSINEEELFRIFETVTKRMLMRTNSRHEATERILSCTKKPSQLLRRQKVTKPLLFKYLMGVGEEVSPESSKAKLVKRCLHVWQSSEQCQESDYEMPEECSLSVMGREFCRWFFPLLNSLAGFGPEHFWPECGLMAELRCPADQTEARVSGATPVVSFLANLVLVEKFGFDACHESIRVEQELHGLVRVEASGVLHRNSDCVGLFDFAFGLIRNPAFDYNWKIKCLRLKMHVSGSLPRALPAAGQYPSLCHAVG